MARRVGLIQSVEKRLDLGGQQDFLLHTIPFYGSCARLL